MSYPIDINDLAYEIHNIARDKGFWDHEELVVSCGEFPNPSIIPEKLMLICTEVSEAMEAVRDGNYDGDHGVDEELADAAIRILDLAQWMRKAGLVTNTGGFRQRIINKKQKNAERPHLHGRKS